jgi:cell division GTPase FtsZ
VKKVVEKFDELVSEYEVKMNLAEILKDYYEERADVTVISFGDCGRRVLGYIMPNELAMANLHSVTLGERTKPKGMITRAKEFVTKTKMSYFKVDLEDRHHHEAVIEHSNGLVQEVSQSLRHISIPSEQFYSSPELAASLLLDTIPRSSVFILVSGFGGSFAQPMHIAFSSLLNSRKIAHMNLVIKPSRIEKGRRQIAQRGILELVKNNVGLKVYDNDTLGPSAVELTPENSMDLLDRINEKVVRDLRMFSIKLSEVAGIIRERLV